MSYEMFSLIDGYEFRKIEERDSFDSGDVILVQVNLQMFSIVTPEGEMRRLLQNREKDVFQFGVF